MLNRVEIKMKSKMQNIKYARSAGVMFFHDINLNLAMAGEIKTIISEAVTNAIIHGYQKNENEEVILYLSYDDQKITIEVVDFGVGIKDIDEARSPMFTTLETEERSGIGFTIMDVFSDYFEVISKPDIGTTIRSIKYYVKEEQVG